MNKEIKKRCEGSIDWLRHHGMKDNTNFALMMRGEYEWMIDYMTERACNALKQVLEDIYLHRKQGSFDTFYDMASAFLVSLREEMMKGGSHD